MLRDIADCSDTAASVESHTVNTIEPYTTYNIIYSSLIMHYFIYRAVLVLVLLPPCI